VQSAVWASGRTSIDALVLSHPDVENFNAVPGLARTLSIGQAFTHASFLDLRRVAIKRTIDALAARDVPIGIVWQGDTLAIDPAVTVRVLHPERGQQFDDDDDNSLVLQIEYAGRTVVLAGDVSGRGQADLLQTEPGGCDLLLAPRRGALVANTRELAAWAQPTWVVVSGGRRGVGHRLEGIYASALGVLPTRDYGAITFHIGSDSQITWHGMLP